MDKGTLMSTPNRSHFTSMILRRPLLVCLLAILGLLVGSAAHSEAAVVTRSVLKSFFEKGDTPSEAQFGTLIDSLISFSDDRNLLGLKQYDVLRAYLGGDMLAAGTSIDASMTFGPAAGLADVWAGNTGFLGLSFTEGSSPDVHYGYLQITAGDSPDVYPMFVEYFVYEDEADMTLAVTPVPEPATLVLMAIGLVTCVAWGRRLRKVSQQCRRVI